MRVRAAAQKLHRQKAVLLVTADLVNLHDVRVTERGRDTRLLEEHADELGATCQIFAHALEHAQARRAGDARLQSQVDVCHTARAEATEGAVTAASYGFARRC